jgi:LytR cell envelope-related transcriptional attenuator
LPEIVQEIGAYAGLASAVGLAVLSALYFSQARDVKRLREWAGRAPERADAQAPAVPGRAPGQPVLPQPQARPGAPAVPGAAPSAASAGARPPAAPVPGTRPGAATPAARPGQPLPAASGAAAKPGGAVPVPAAAGAGTAAPPKPGGPGQNAGAEGASPPPAPPSGAPAQGAPAANSGTAAAGAQKAPAASPGGAPPAGPVTPAGQRPPAAPPVPPPARAAPPMAPGGAGGPARPAGQPTAVIPPPSRPPWYRRLLANPLYTVLAVAGVLILGGAAAFGVTELVSGGDGGSSEPDQLAGGESGEDPQGESSEDRGRSGGAKARKGAAVKPGNVTVAVLNGTTVPGLAATLADQVTAAGFKAGTIANFGPNQQLAESVVQYSAGHEREAAAVSRKLRIGQRETASAESQELAGDATVIVIAGGDKAP